MEDVERYVSRKGIVVDSKFEVTIGINIHKINGMLFGKMR